MKLAEVHVYRAWVLAIGVAVCAVGLLGCSQKTEAPSTQQTSETPAEKPAAASEQPEPRAWKIYVNDDQDWNKGGMTYSVALNLTATNPSSEIAGVYTGKATARTTSVGDVGEGGKLNASAIAKSKQLEFTLEGSGGNGAAGGSAGGGDAGSDDPLAPLTVEGAQYSGTGSVTMAASGSGTVTGRGRTAGGGFGKTSSEPVEVQVKGTDVYFTVTIQGHRFTFKGTISPVQ